MLDFQTLAVRMLLDVDYFATWYSLDASWIAGTLALQR